jgi:hypothetical protein
MSHLTARIRIESPQRDEKITSHYILQQRMRRKVLNLKLENASFNTKTFKEIYSGMVLDMSYDRLQKLSQLEDETEIVLFLRRKGNNKEKNPELCDGSTSSPVSPCSAHALQGEPA